ncbi:hypothetical protein BP5796_12501 [Coleophoma crateriformis]|uniref:RTA1-domain-containing protein n=1 Tax=Coleophoma crateriformis TaxID=565419 RepID=A0A3D8Q7R3_9HELO|nr:hypothetical protein BP5796_12501 [Coleophoma crateriformis]
MVSCDLKNPDYGFNYCPSLPAAILFTVLYGLAVIGHIFLAYKYRKPFCWVLIMGGTWEFISILTRVVLIFSPYNQPLSNVSFVFLVLAPLWINAFDYMVLGRMIYYFLPDHKVLGVRAERVAVFFITSDITSFLIQLCGALFAVRKNATSTTQGLHIYTAGVCIQEAVIIGFFVFSIIFQRRLPSATRSSGATKLIYVLYASLALITYRIIFRIVEFSAGAKSSIHRAINNHEWYVYVFDEAPMLLALVVFLIYHPGRALKGPGSEFPKLTKEQKVARKEEKKRIKDERKIQQSGRGHMSNDSNHIGLVDTDVEARR